MNNRANRQLLSLDYPDVKAHLSLQSRIPVSQCSSLQNPSEGIWDNTPLSIAFFSSANISIIQNALRRGVYMMSNRQYIIANQDCDTLKIIMRSIFLQFSRNLPTNICEQIEQLNKQVLNYCIPQVYQETRGYLTYLANIDKPPTPMALPIYTDHLNKSLVMRSPGF